MIKGIDVSRHNGTIDFTKVKSDGIEFVYVKATEGKTYTDPMFQPNMYNALKAGLKVGAYHFARPDNGNTPEDEATNFVNTISKFQYTLIPVLDLEVSVSMSDAALFDWSKRFIDAVKAKTGQNVMFYSYLSYINNYPALKNLAQYGVPLWIAAYRSTEPTVTGWDWTVWQYSDSGSVAGITTVCDMNWAKTLDSILVIQAQPQVNNKPSVPQFTRYLKLTTPYMEGNDVKLVQQRLGVKPVDGIYGPQTAQAVRNFQKQRGLQVDGIVGPETWKALFSPAPKRPPIPPFKRYLKLTNPYMRGDDVKLVQKRLAVTPVDGIYGPTTEQAVKRFQKFRGLKADGIVGPDTWKALFS